MCPERTIASESALSTGGSYRQQMLQVGDEYVLGCALLERPLGKRTVKKGLRRLSGCPRPDAVARPPTWTKRSIHLARPTIRVGAIRFGSAPCIDRNGPLAGCAGIYCFAPLIVFSRFLDVDRCPESWGSFQTRLHLNAETQRGKGAGTAGPLSFLCDFATPR